MTFGQKLKDLRSLKKITQSDLAKEIGIARTTIAGYEQGKQEPSYKILKKVASYFNVSIDYLLGHNLSKTNPRIETIAAHLDSNELSDTDLDDIERFVQFVKNKNKL